MQTAQALLGFGGFYSPARETSALTEPKWPANEPADTIEPISHSQAKQPGYNLGSDSALDHDCGQARPSGLLATNVWWNQIKAAFQITDPSRWIATQATIFLPTLIGSTRQYMMKGVPSFL